MVTLLPMPANSNKPDADETGERTIATSLARAEAAVANLAQDYASWALADVAKARAALAAAIDDPSGRGQHVDALFRVGHDLKGQGTSFGFPLVTKIGHSLCVLTRERARHYESRHLDLAKSHLDALDLILAKGIKGEGGKVGVELVAKLEQRVSELLG
jgi:hypothetical protein